ncbi:hypothetical protein HXX76_015464 [Chlamydomonas incerta]|uniref:Uncharacterized protein n=1 Tax=Chlamydomonas incerta TaxID=51695 RepID=A0A835SEL1_CHLIN|nr:hypothetical protein HXX76_015464 [Chlamydomonas incerta]|eukprot:KAG2423317.1 hypothetical protein HXX76_015464 [Chlamydomonas incerta]
MAAVPQAQSGDQTPPAKGVAADGEPQKTLKYQGPVPEAPANKQGRAKPKNLEADFKKEEELYAQAKACAVDLQKHLAEKAADDVLQAHTQLFIELRSSQAALKEKEAELEEKDAELEKKGATLKEKDAELEEKDAELERKGATLKEKDAELATTQGLLEEALEKLEAESRLRLSVEAALEEKEVKLAETRALLEEALERKEAESLLRLSVVAALEENAAELAGSRARLEAAMNEAEALLQLSVVGQPDPDRLFKGPLPFGAAADSCLLGMVGSDLCMGPGWAFVNDSPASKLHKAKCGNLPPGFKWYHYATLTGRTNTQVALCDNPRCRKAFNAEQDYLKA